MKNFKRVCSMVLALCMCFGAVYAETILSYQPAHWYYAANGGATAQANADGVIELQCDKTVKSNAEVDTSSFELKGTLFDISFDIALEESGENCERSVLLRDKNETSMELLQIQGRTLTLLKEKSKTITLSENQTYSFCFSFDLSEKNQATVTLNDESVFSGKCSNYNPELDLLNAYLRFRNYTTKENDNSFAMMVDKVTVEAENTPPVIDISGISRGEVLQSGDTATISFRAVDDYGVSKMELYINGEKVKTYNTDEGTYTLSDLSYGSHEISVCAYDIYGVESTKTIIFSVSDTVVSDEGFTEDFTNIQLDGIGTVTTANGIKVMGQSGYYKTLKIDEEHGNSLAVGITTVNPGQTSSPWMAMPTGGITTGLQFSCDFYLSEKANDYSIRFKKDGGAEIYAITLNDAMDCQSVKDIPFNDGVWNKLDITVDIANLTYTVSLNGTVVAKKVEMSAIDQIDYIRFFGPNKDDVQTYLAIDNVTIRELVTIPYFKSVSYNGNTITAKLSAALYSETFSKNNIEVVDAYGKKQTVTAAKCEGNTVTVTLSESCDSNTRYTLTLSEDTRISAALTMGQPVSISFTTETEGLEAEKVSFITKGSQTVARVNIANDENEKKNVYIICSVWNGKNFEDATAKAYEAEANSQSILEFTFDTPKNGSYAEIYVKDALVKGKSLIKKIYTTEE